MKHILFGIVLFLFAKGLLAQNETQVKTEEQKKTYTTQRLSTAKPVIDGKLYDDCWKNNNWGDDFIQWIPNEGQKPTFPTYINILYDEKNIYVAIRAIDNEPEKIVRKASRRDEILGDMAGINFDSYHDHRTGFEFNVSAAGQKIDLILTNPSIPDMSWDAVWTVKVGMEDSAWVAEYEIPFSQLRYSDEKEQVWGMHVWRWLDRKQEESDWEPLTSTGPGMLYQFGELRGISNLPKSRRLELMPYLLGKVTTLEKDAANPYAKNGYRPFGSIGLDAKIGLSSNFTADVTINPDFGQVESDPSVMNLSAFETFYNEKRPFFLEGKNIYNFDFDGNNLFYSRRIGQSPHYNPEIGTNEHMRFPDNTSILGAVKVSGKSSKGLAVGILESITSSEFALINNGSNERKEFVEPMTNYTVARVQQDFNAGTTVLGGIVTSTNRFLNHAQFDFLNRNALTGGIDFLHQWHDKEFFIDAKLVGSSINGAPEAIHNLQISSARFYQRPNAEHLNFDSTLTQLSGYGGNLKIGKGSKGNWRYSTSMCWRSPGLDLNDIGYMQTADMLKNTNEISYFISETKGKLRQFNAGFTQLNNWDYARNYLSSQFSVNVSGQFLNQWSVNTHICHFPNSVDNRILRGGSAMRTPARTHGNIGFNTDYSRKASFSFNAFYEGGSENSSSNISISPSVTYQPFSTLKFSVSIDYSENMNELQYVHQTTSKQNQVYLLGRIDQKTLGTTFRVDYIITPELSIQYYGSPFASTGKFSNFKNIDNPMADSYTNRFELLAPTFSENSYTTSDYSFDNPDFTFTQFRSNLVFRWEYLPGSKLFVVWSNERTNFQSEVQSKIGDAFKDLNSGFPNNVFLIKWSYWFSI